MKKYGKELMTEAPNETTDSLKLLCTDYRPSNSMLGYDNKFNGPLLESEENIRLCVTVWLFAYSAPMIDELSLTESRRQRAVQKASPEEFIHVFVNNSKKLTEFLEHMVKVSNVSFGDFIYCLLKIL